MKNIAPLKNTPTRFNKRVEDEGENRSRKAKFFQSGSPVNATENPSPAKDILARTNRSRQDNKYHFNHRSSSELAEIAISATGKDISSAEEMKKTIADLLGIKTTQFFLHKEAIDAFLKPQVTQEEEVVFLENSVTPPCPEDETILLKKSVTIDESQNQTLVYDNRPKKHVTFNDARNQTRTYEIEKDYMHPTKH